MPRDSQTGKMIATLEYDLSDLPMEVSDYAFDQLADRLATESRGGKEQTLENAHLAYESQKALFDQTVIGSVLRQACVEKLTDIEQEVKRGDRADHTVQDIKSYRAQLDTIF